MKNFIIILWLYRHRENSKMFMNNFNFNFKLCEMKIHQLFFIFLFAVCEKFFILVVELGGMKRESEGMGCGK